MLVAALERKNRIEDLLKARNLSIYRLAKLVDMSYNGIHNIVKSDSIPPGTDYITLIKIARALDVGIDDLEE